VWFGLYFLFTAVASGVAVGTGRLRWWPVAVVASSIVVQCQAAFAPPAVSVCLVAPVVGVAILRRTNRRVGSGWLAVGLGLGAAAWAAPLVQEVTTRPGNLTLLARAARGPGAPIGWSAALHALGGATSVPPTWVHPLPPSGIALFVAIVHTFDGPAWWGVLVLVLLAVVAAVAWRTLRPALASMALVTLALAVGAMAAIATVPSEQFLVVGYLGALWVPVATAVWVTLVWALGELVLAAFRPGRVTGLPRGATARWERPTRAAVGVVLVLASVGVVWRGLDRMDGVTPTLAGWPAVHTTAAAADAVARVAPRGPFRLEVTGPGSASQLAIVTGVAYLLVTRGFDPRPDSPIAYATFGRPPSRGPTVVVEVPHGGGPVGVRLVGG
jgi:hypothetical protein